MALDIWLAEDIRNALLAADEASAATAANVIPGRHLADTWRTPGRSLA